MTPRPSSTRFTGPVSWGL